MYWVTVTGSSHILLCYNVKTLYYSIYCNKTAFQENIFCHTTDGRTEEDSLRYYIGFVTIYSYLLHMLRFFPENAENWAEMGQILGLVHKT